MNELFFSFRTHLNVKKICIIGLIFIVILLLIIFSKMNNQDSTQYISNTTFFHPKKDTVTFFSNDNSASLEISNVYGLKKYNPTQNYLIELRSNSDLNVFISLHNKIEGKNLKDIVSADKSSFLENFSNSSNIFEIQEITINGYTGCTYSFHYLDEPINKTFYVQVSWLEIDNNYYIFDIEFPLQDLNNYHNIVTDVLNNFKKLK